MGNLLQCCDEYFRCFSKLRPVLHSKSGSLKDLSLRKKISLPRCFCVRNFHTSRANNCSLKKPWLRDKHCRVRPSFERNEAEFGVYEYTFLHEMLFLYFWRLFLKEAFFKFWPKMLPGKTLCKLLQIFPPKVLVYIRNISLNTFFDSIENCLRQIKWFVEYVTYWVYIEGQ